MPYPDDQVDHISLELKKLKPGPLAELRRMAPDQAGPPAFWRLVAALKLDQEDVAVWQRVMRIMAILSEKGDPARREAVHDRKRPLGHALADGGDPHWSPPPGDTPRPVLSEARFSRFLALPGPARGEALERMARALARTRVAGCGVNCADIARLLLFPEDPAPIRQLARTFYDRLDRAARKETDTEGTV